MCLVDDADFPIFMVEDAVSKFRSKEDLEAKYKEFQKLLRFLCF